MLSCVNDTRKVVQAIRLGAQDYLTKPFQKAELEAVIDQSLGQGKRPPAAKSKNSAKMFLYRASPAMRKIRSQAALVANVDIPVLLLGESGTGKEVLARLIHKLSPRAHRTFLKVNCAAVPADLLESELFGYEPEPSPARTTPSPASSNSATRARSCSTKSARCRRCCRRSCCTFAGPAVLAAGQPSVIKVDVRILAATNINIPEALASKRLREDLYYRLNAFTLRLPPLRERKEEIPILLKHSMSRMAEHYARPPLPLSPACCRPARIIRGRAICAS